MKAEWIEYNIFTKSQTTTLQVAHAIGKEWFGKYKGFFFYEPDNELRLRLLLNKRGLKVVAANLTYWKARGWILSYKIKYYQREERLYGQWTDWFIGYFMNGSRLSLELYKLAWPRLKLERKMILSRVCHCLANQMTMSFGDEIKFHFNQAFRYIPIYIKARLGLLKC